MFHRHRFEQIQHSFAKFWHVPVVSRSTQVIIIIIECVLTRKTNIELVDLCDWFTFLPIILKRNYANQPDLIKPSKGSDTNQWNFRYKMDNIFCYALIRSSNLDLMYWIVQMGNMAFIFTGILLSTWLFTWRYFE